MDENKKPILKQYQINAIIVFIVTIALFAFKQDEFGLIGLIIGGLILMQ